MEDMVTECETVNEEVCAVDPTTEQEVCKTFPKQQCVVVNKERTEFVPEVKCKKLQTQVCGSEACPLAKAEPVCYDEVKDVSNYNTHILLKYLIIWLFFPSNR